MVNKQWFTPAEFEGLAGKRSWRKSIRCKGTPLGKLIQVRGKGIFILWSKTV